MDPSRVQPSAIAGIAKKDSRHFGRYFCEGFQRSGSRSRYFSIGVFGGHALLGSGGELLQWSYRDVGLDIV